MGTCNGKHQLSAQDTFHQTQYTFLTSTDGYEKIPLVALEKAVEPLISFLPTIQTYVHIAKEKCQSPADGLTSDESASIMLYSMGWQPLNECLYVVLNATLQSLNRQKLQPWFLYLKLLFTAVLCLPSLHLTVYRGDKSDLSKQYEIDETILWWDFSLCTTSIEHLQSEKCLGQTETRTMFTIECNTVKDIRKHTYFQSDNCVLILPGTKFKVRECFDQNDDLHLITLQEIQSSFLLQSQTSPIKCASFSRSFRSRPKKVKKLSAASSISNGKYRNVSLEQKIVESARGWTVDIDEQNLTDRDMKIVVKHAIIKNHCKRIRIRDNEVTSQGAAILAEGINNNMILESLDLRNNHILDLGVHSLALAIIHSNLKTLNLESNGITVEGAKYLADMLNNNRTLTELYLSKNHIGDQGVEFLANALCHDKRNVQDQENKGICATSSSTLQHLYLGQNDITDIGIEYLADMLKTNRTLTWLWLSSNNISDQGVELLANVLADFNISLEWLFLNSNKGITDQSIDALIRMLERNYSLKTFYINNCSLSDTGKRKIHEMIKSKKDFDLEV